MKQERQSQILLSPQESLVVLEEQEVEKVMGGVLDHTPLLNGAPHVSDQPALGSTNEGSYLPPDEYQKQVSKALAAAEAKTRKLSAGGRGLPEGTDATLLNNGYARISSPDKISSFIKIPK